MALSNDEIRALMASNAERAGLHNIKREELAAETPASKSGVTKWMSGTVVPSELMAKAIQSAIQRIIDHRAAEDKRLFTPEGDQ